MANTNWYFPIIGETEFSGGSWMPDSLTHRGRTHAAIDVYAEMGAPIIAPVSGVVQTVKTSDIGGHTVSFLGDDGITYYFAHMAQPSPVLKGQRLNIGSYVGAVGNSGSAKNTKPHLHLSMKRNGSPINPYQYLKTGYKIPANAFEASMGSPDPYPNVAFEGLIKYVDPFEVAQTALADSEPYEQPKELSAAEFFSRTMEGFSSYVTGGAQRADYMTLGQRNVPRARVEVRVATDVRDENEGQAEEPV